MLINRVQSDVVESLAQQAETEWIADFDEVLDITKQEQIISDCIPQDEEVLNQGGTSMPNLLLEEEEKLPLMSDI